MHKLFALFVLCAALLCSTCLSSFGQESSLADTAKNAESVPESRPITVTVELTDETRIAGTLIDMSTVAMKTAFGEAIIPLAEVAGLHFPSKEDAGTTVVMLNGDSITGTTAIEFIQVETSWGSAKVNGPAISTMLFVPGLAWTNSEGLGGKRWTLSNKPPVKNAPSTGKPATGAPLPSDVVIPSGAPHIIYGR